MERTEIVIAGAGLGGLCAAAGLRRAGFDVRVLERDTGLAARPQGYRINVNATGDAALRTCLPPSHFHLYRDTAHQQADPSVDVFTPGLQQVSHRHADPAGAAGPPPSAVDRATLRAVLADAAGGQVTFGAEVTRLDVRTDHVIVHTGGGTQVRAAIVVAADGAGSAVRRQLLPGHDPSPLGITGIYGRAPLDADGLTWLPRGVVDQRFVGLTDSSGTTLALGGWLPRRAPRAAAAQRVPGLDLHAPHPYVMWVLLGPDQTMPGEETPPTALCAFARDRTTGWEPAATQFVREAAEDDTFRVSLHAMRAVPTWATGRVTFLGDAVHTMSPAGGEGANTAMADAASLTEQLRRHGCRPEALAGYEHDMRARAQATLDRSRSYGQGGGKVRAHA
jgi:2-polyprenyl-6-methoxyphenol hydroxylase-like FAD-dependent oxidoreductase